MIYQNCQPSQDYLAYVARVREEVTGVEPERWGFFEPCPRYERIEDGCAICANSREDRPCPDRAAMFTGVCETPEPDEGSQGGCVT